VLQLPAYRWNSDTGCVVTPTGYPEGCIVKRSTILISALSLLATVLNASAASWPEAAPPAVHGLSTIFLPVVGRVWPNAQKEIGDVSW
jgi:hypothetical protein